MVNARRAWKYSQTRCMTFLKWQTSVSMDTVLDRHTVLPLATLTQFEMARIALRGMETGVTQDNHLLFALANEPLKVLSATLAVAHTPRSTPLISSGRFAADNPA